jgi:hypothetical protein
MKLTRVECPKCAQPLVSKMRNEDLLFVCECGTIHIRDPKPKELEYQIAPPRNAHRPDNVYVPVWRVWAHVAIHDSDVVGGLIFSLTSLFDGGGGGYAGDVAIFVPATKLPAQEFRKWATTLTRNPPHYAPSEDFGRIPRLPCNISENEAKELADFIILTNEAERPGTLQNIRYTMTVNHMSLVFLPFVRDVRGTLHINL